MTAGDSIEFLSREPEAVTIAEMNQLFAFDRYNEALLKKAIATSALPEDWRDYFRKRQHGIDASTGVETAGPGDR